MLPKCASMCARRMRLTSSSALTGGIPANTVPALASSLSERRRTAAAAAAASFLWSAIVSARVQPANSLAWLSVHLVEHRAGEVRQRPAGGDRLDDPGGRLVAALDVVRPHRPRPFPRR